MGNINNEKLTKDKIESLEYESKSVQKILIDYIEWSNILTDVNDDSVNCLKNEAERKGMEIEIIRPEYGLAAIELNKILMTASLQDHL
ncbi:uncharacterized protein KGF55_004604 [Candida pseudojiufengensis]|uniref:uncharacterized protein n=1 Tax=Candida pseudojiufengensis TaxID=497109 RepID=UPI002225452A|nr:uncharacterized protein KGF55_004604 [Candida pseudojiufengensis]KAI5960312.1 hypothetical protein KGF55_004604 [Candida pseudojiufengensis]